MKSDQLIASYFKVVVAIVLTNKDFSKKKVSRTVANAIRGYRDESPSKRQFECEPLSAYPKK